MWRGTITPRTGNDLQALASSLVKDSRERPCPRRPRAGCRGPSRPAARSGPRTAVRSPAPAPQLRHVDGGAVVVAGGDERVDRWGVGQAALPVLDYLIQRRARENGRGTPPRPPIVARRLVPRCRHAGRHAAGRARSAGVPGAEACGRAGAWSGCALIGWPSRRRTVTSRYARRVAVDAGIGRAPYGVSRTHGPGTGSCDVGARPSRPA